MTYAPPPFPVGLTPGKKSPSAKSLQAALKKAKLMSVLVIPTDVYGPFTQAGVKRFHKAHPQFGTATDGGIGPMGWAFLFRLAYGGGVHAVVEPVGDYHRVVYGGHTVNVRTRILLQRAEAALKIKVHLAQGSYNKGVAASAGTHDGGGVVDVSVSGWSTAEINRVVRGLRVAGFAAWHRTPAEGFAHHIHACAIGDREMAPLAKQQVQSYFNGHNGLAGNGYDDGPRNLWPAWARKYNQ